MSLIKQVKSPSGKGLGFLNFKKEQETIYFLIE